MFSKLIWKLNFFHIIINTKNLIFQGLHFLYIDGV